MHNGLRRRLVFLHFGLFFVSFFFVLFYFFALSTKEGLFSRRCVLYSDLLSDNHVLQTAGGSRVDVDALEGEDKRSGEMQFVYKAKGEK